MGKSSLLARILHQSENQGNITVAIDFLLAEEEFFSDLNKFLRWFCDTVTEAVAGNNRELLEKLLQQLDEYWKSGQQFGYMKTCKNYFERYLFPITTPVCTQVSLVDDGIVEFNRQFNVTNNHQVQQITSSSFDFGISSNIK